MQKVFYVPGSASAIDYAREADTGVMVSYIRAETLEQIRVRHPAAVIGTEQEFVDQMEAALISPPQEISADEFDGALDCLPPQDWQGLGTNAESFKFLERFAGRITSIYARVGVTHYRFHDICTLGHAEIIAKVKAAAASACEFCGQQMEQAHACTPEALAARIERAGYALAGPTDHRAAENGEPLWVCRGRAMIAEALNPKRWAVDLANDGRSMRVSMASVPGADVQEAEQNALALLAEPESWRVTGIDRG